MVPTSKTPRRRRAGRLMITLIVGFVFVMILSARGVARFYTDYLWFDSLRFTSVWSGVLLTKVGLALVFSAGFFLLCWANLLVAQRLAPPVRPAGPEENTLAEVHKVLDRRPGAFRAGTALVLACLFGIGAASRWNEWLLFRNHVAFDARDASRARPALLRLQLPFLTFVANALFAFLCCRHRHRIGALRQRRNPHAQMELSTSWQPVRGDSRTAWREEASQWHRGAAPSGGRRPWRSRAALRARSPQREAGP